MTEKYRFDDAYEKIYRFDSKSNAYIFCGTYFAFGISKKDSDKIKIKKTASEDNYDAEE